MITETSSGGVLANDCLVHVSVSFLPFRGVGNSGMGSYHSKSTFNQMSHLRSCLIKYLKMEGMNVLRYPPHTAKKLDWTHLNCPTRGQNTLDHVYTNIKHVYKAIQLPHLDESDHLSLLLTPAYMQGLLL